MSLTEELKTVETIDMTPTWRGVLPIMIAALQDGTFDARKAAREELERMADLADAYVAEHKGRKE